MTSVACRFTRFFFALGFLHSAAQASAPISALQRTSASDHWTSSAVQTTWYFNQDLLGPLGIKIGNTENAITRLSQHRSAAYQQLSFSGSMQTALEFSARGRQLTALTGGGLRHAGGFVLQFNGGTADLRDFDLQPAPGSTLGMQVVDRAGRVWFRLDHPHYALSKDGQTLSLTNMNLRLSAQFAAALGRPEFANMVVGALDSISTAYAPVLATTAQSADSTLPICAATYAWQSPTHTADITLIYGNGDLTGGVPDQINFERCKIPTAAGFSNCTPDSTDGLVVLAPDASLQNIGTSSVAWNAMFNRNNNGQPQPPYNNDQHPYLVWNLYRVDANGAIKQIGVSAAKHAFYSVNFQCSCDPGHAPSVVYPTCQDNYSGATNDFADYLGPRHEIVPATGQWGRCGSVFDPTCSGQNVGPSDDYGSVDPQRHMVVRESDITPALNPGAQYFFEYWYVIRDAQTPYSSMGYRALSNFHKVLGGDGISSIWQFDTAELTGGSVINTWSPPPDVIAIDSDNVEIATPDGHARIAVRTHALGGGKYHYDYAVMNVDFAHAVIDPAHASDDLSVNPQGLKLLSNVGFSRFSIPVAAKANISNLTFADADANPANDWVATIADQHIVWQAPDGNTLNWGMLYAFGFDADQAPNSGSMLLSITSSDAAAILPTAAATGTDYVATTLAPVTYVLPAILPALSRWSLFAISVLIVFATILRWRRDRLQ
jgi:hypothetical protein